MPREILIALAMATTAGSSGCSDYCEQAKDRAEECDVEGLEIEDDLLCNDDTSECRAKCIDAAPCDEIRASFAGGTDRSTEAWMCYSACGI